MSIPLRCDPFRWQVMALVLAVVSVIAAGCSKSPGKTDTGKQPRSGGNATSGNEPIAIFNDAADVLESIRDKPSLQAAESKLAAIGQRLQPIKPVVTTAIYLGRLAPGIPPQLQGQLEQQVRNDPDFAPHISDGEALAKNGQFRNAYKHYNSALRQAEQRVPGTLTAVSRYIAVGKNPR